MVFPIVNTLFQIQVKAILLISIHVFECDVCAAAAAATTTTATTTTTTTKYYYYHRVSQKKYTKLIKRYLKLITAINDM